MVRKSYRAVAPGTLMVLGEHAVLENKPAIVLAIDKFITVNLFPRLDQKILIKSDLGEIALELDKIALFQDQKSFQFILAAIKFFQKALKHEKENQGFELRVESTFSHECGLGSSAAVTVATVAVLSQWISNATDDIDKPAIFEISKNIIRAVQGVGSGADVAASVYGGVIVYQQQAPYVVKRFDSLLPLVAVYSGSKTSTPIVVKKVAALKDKYALIIDKLYEAMEHSVNQAAIFIENKNWQQLGEVMNIQQGVMNALGVGTPILNQIVELLNKDTGIYGAKISGSGLGDCVVGIGVENNETAAIEALGMGVKKIPLSVSLQGVCYG